MVTKQKILDLVSEYIKEKHSAKTWTPGKDWVQYSGPYFTDDEYVRAISTLLDEWLVLGQDAIEFEKKFPPLLGKKYGVVTNSGSSANLLMMLAAKKKLIGHQVIIPVAGFPTTLNPIIQASLTPVFVDIELDTLNLNLDQVEQAARNGAKTLMFAHVLGNPPNMDKLMNIVNSYGITLLEDCCDGLGSKYDDKLLGGFGKFSTCSFYPAHHMTMGEGGFVACDTKEDEKLLRSLREWGRGCYCVGKSAGLSTKGTCGCRFNKWLSSLPDEIFDHKYIYDQIGYNLKPIELQCSIGLAQLDKLPEIHAIRKSNHVRLSKIFYPYKEYFHIHGATEKSDPSWFAFPMTIRNGAPFKRSQFISYLESKKIQTRTYFGGNLLLQPAYQNKVWTDYSGIIHIDNGGVDRKNKFPVATKVTTDTLFLGTSPVISEKQLDYIEEIVKEFIKNI